MSSILKALKKAEQESHETGGRNTSPIRPAVLTTLNLRIKRQQSRFSINPTQLVIASGLVILTALFLAYYLIITKNDPAPKQVSQNTDLQAPVEIPVKETIKKSTDKTSTALPPVKPDERQKKVTAQRKMDRTPIKKPAIPPLKFNMENTISETRSPGPPAPYQKTLDVEQKPGPDMIPMKDGILKIQAISWAPAPADRVAVINNKILEEKDFIENYRILHIEKDAVILQLSNQRFKLEFKYR